MKKLIFFNLILIIMIISTINFNSAKICIQNNAIQHSDLDTCTELNYSGNYNDYIYRNATSMSNFSNFYDDNLNTFTTSNNYSGYGSNIIIINYSIPQDITYARYYYTENGISYSNALVTTGCWNLTTNTITMKINITQYFTDSKTNFSISCKNETSWKTFSTSETLYRRIYYEDYMNWTIAHNLQINFSSITNITMTWTNGGTTFINNNSIRMSEDDIGLGIVNIVYNNGAQAYSFTNNNDRSIYENLTVTTNSQLIKVQATSGGTLLSNALVQVYRVIAGVGNTQIYSTYTDSAGVAYVYGYPDDMHTFTVSKEGYTTKSTTLFIPNGFADTVTINLDSTSSTNVKANKWYSNCGVYINEPKTCTFTMDYNNVYNTILINVYNSSDDIVDTKTCTNNNYCRTSGYSTTQDNTPIYAKLFTDGTQRSHELYVNFENQTNKSINIGFDKDSINVSNTTRGIFYVIVFIVGLFLSVSVNRKVDGWGLPAMLLWFTIIAVTVFPFFWLISIPAILVFLFKIIRGLF